MLVLGRAGIMRARGENRRKVMEFIKACAPRGVSSADIARRTGISQASAYQIARALMEEGFVRAARDGRVWRFSWNANGRMVPGAGSGRAAPAPTPETGEGDFPARVRQAVEEHYGCSFDMAAPDDLSPAWRLVGDDGAILGQALHLAPLADGRVPAGRLTLLSGLVWLLEKSEAERPFMVIGGDSATADAWRAHHGSCCDEVEVFYLDDGGELSRLV